MDLSLSPEQLALQASVRDWVQDTITPNVREWDRAEKLPSSVLDGLAQTGLIGLTIDEKWGGEGADPMSYVLAVEELARGDANVRSILSVHLGLVAGGIAKFGTSAQQEQWLPRMASGEVIGCFGLTEPGAGSDPSSLISKAERTATGWRLSGEKIFITNGTIAGLCLFMARTGGPGSRGVSAFLVPTDTPGFTATKVTGKLGLRSCDTAALHLDGVEVGPEALLGETEGTGIKVALSNLDDGRMSMAASCTGVAQAALDAMISYTTQRTQFGKPIAGHQLVQELLADTALDVDASRLLTWAVADRKMRGESYTVAASKAKLFASEASVRAANNCIQAHGGYGYIDEYPGAKLLRDARVTTLYEGTSQIQKLLIGRALTGISAF
ncbi:MAG: acyl-CoA dehydrogenase [Mycobacterium sp.]|nr:acyl-CoA dehydrogenase [Mycobacterium sp.]